MLRLTVLVPLIVLPQTIFDSVLGLVNTIPR